MAGAEYSGYSQVMLKTAEAEFLLCTLVHGMIFQQTLDVQLKKGEEISVYTEGKSMCYTPSIFNVYIILGIRDTRIKV